MNIRPFLGYAPTLAASVWVDPAAQVIGNVTLGESSSVWAGAVLRGDSHAIRIGARTCVLDGALLHVAYDAQYTLGGFSLSIGDDVTIGHGAVLHGCSVQGASIIGMRAVILDGVLVKENSIVGAGAVVTHGTIIGSGEVWVGNPARCLRMLSDEDLRQIHYTARQHVRRAAQYRQELANAALRQAPALEQCVG